MIRKTINYSEAVKAVWNGQDLLFTFKEDAEQFAQQAGFEITYKNPVLMDEYFEVKGSNSKLYWL